jgi:hypothetical protein
VLSDSHPELMEAHPHSYLISHEEGPYVRHRLECLKVKVKVREEYGEGEGEEGIGLG